MEWDRQPSGEAEALATNELLNSLFDALERDAHERALSAHYSDDETRRLCAMEQNAVRTVRKQLTDLASGKAKLTRKGPAA